MSGKHLQRRNRDVATPVRAVLFIEQKPDSFKRANVRAIASHARRWQTKRKHQELKDDAQREAVYARGLVGWQSRSSSSSDKASQSALDLDLVRPAKYETQQETETPEEMPWQISGGLRSDPFDSLPSPKSREVMQMVDYYVHIWSRLKTTALDAMLGCNTQLDLCWPYALQSSMLFNASLAVSRVAWCLMQAISVAKDQLILQHRGVAMNQMRELLSTPIHSSEVELIFTIGRMLSITYMSSEPASFEIHLQAFRRIAGPYIAEHPDSDLTSVIANRLNSWTALQAFRDRWDPLKDQESCDEGSSESSQGRGPVFMTTDSADLEGSVPLAEPAAAFSLSNDVLTVLKPLTRVLGTMSGSGPPPDRQSLLATLTNHCRSLEQILTQLHLSDLDSQFCCGLVAFCLQLRHLINAKNVGTVADDSRKESYNPEPQLAVPSTSHLNAIAKSFINKGLANALQSLRHKSCIAWSAIVLGSYLLHTLDNRLRTRGHIILISVRETIMAECPLRNTEFGWDALRNEIATNMGVLWHKGLEELWEQDWHSTMARQHQWEAHGLLKIGVPIAEANGAEAEVDLIEYLVLREARDSLPRIEEPEYVM